MVLACAALVVAGLVAATRWRSFVSFSSVPSPGLAVLAVIVAIGVTSARPEMVALDVPAPWAAAVALLALTFGTVCAVYWTYEVGLVRWAALAGSALLSVLFAVVMLVILLTPRDDLETAFVAGQTASTLGACIVPVVAAAVVPRRPGAVLLGSWVVAEVAFLAEAAIEWDYNTSANIVFLAACAVAMGLAYVIWRSAPASEEL